MASELLTCFHKKWNLNFYELPEILHILWSFEILSFSEIWDWLKNCFLWIHEMSSSIRSQLKLCEGVLAWFLKWYFHYLPMACWSLKRSLLVIPCFQNSFFLTLLRPRLWAILRLRRLTALFASIIFKEILFFLYKNFSVNFNFFKQKKLKSGKGGSD